MFLINLVIFVSYCCSCILLFVSVADKYGFIIIIIIIFLCKFFSQWCQVSKLKLNVQIRVRFHSAEFIKIGAIRVKILVGTKISQIYILAFI